MIMIWVPKRLVEVGLYNVAALSPKELVEYSEQSYHDRLHYAAEKIRASGAKIVMLTGPSASGKTTTSHGVARELKELGIPAQVISTQQMSLSERMFQTLIDILLNRIRLIVIKR